MIIKSFFLKKKKVIYLETRNNSEMNSKKVVISVGTRGGPSKPSTVWWLRTRGLESQWVSVLADKIS